MESQHGCQGKQIFSLLVFLLQVVKPKLVVSPFWLIIRSLLLQWLLMFSRPKYACMYYLPLKVIHTAANQFMTVHNVCSLNHHTWHV